jgi:hypothetical protein
MFVCMFVCLYTCPPLGLGLVRAYQNLRFFHLSYNRIDHTQNIKTFASFTFLTIESLRRVGLYLFSMLYLAGWRANTRNQK